MFQKLPKNNDFLWNYGLKWRQKIDVRPKNDVIWHFDVNLGPLNHILAP